jgi:hypothetical protein
MRAIIPLPARARIRGAWNGGEVITSPIMKRLCAGKTPIKSVVIENHDTPSESLKHCHCKKHVPTLWPSQSTVRIAMHSHLGLDVVTTMPFCRYLKVKILETHAIIITCRALELFAQDAVEAAPYPGDEGAALFSGRHGKPGVRAFSVRMMTLVIARRAAPWQSMRRFSFLERRYNLNRLLDCHGPSGLAMTRGCLLVRDGKAGRDTSLARNGKKHSGFGLCRHPNRKRSRWCRHKILTHKAIHRICTAATKEATFLA